MIERTSEMLKDNSVRIQEQAASATIGLPQLQAAFANIYATMDAIDTFKVKALDSMAATIGVAGDRGRRRPATYLDRVQQHDDHGRGRAARSTSARQRRAPAEWRSLGRAAGPADRAAAARRSPTGSCCPRRRPAADLLAAVDQVEPLVAGAGARRGDLPGRAG